MTEDEHGPDFKNVMFVVGAQTDNDGDFLPQSFTVFSRIIGPIEAVDILMEKITTDIADLKMDVAHGQIAFTPIETWEQFAAISEIDDVTKMKALAVAIATGYMGSLAEVRNERVVDLITLPWTPDTD